MTIIKVENLFSEKQLDALNKMISNGEVTIDEKLGRSQVILNSLGEENIGSKILEIGNNLSLSSAIYVEYSNNFGQPNLPPHYDGDNSDLIVNYQLSSNTSWDIGLGLETYSLEDNSALIFNPNEHIHWRPIKQFEAVEYVKMIFFRLWNTDNTSDYSHLRYSLDNPIFDEVKKIRDKGNNG
jgi:hypothetical protein